MFRLMFWVVLAGVAAAQTQVDLRTQTKRVDFSLANSTKPVKSVSSLPLTCSAGELVFNTSAAAGANLYACTSANVWSLQGGGGTITINGQPCALGSSCSVADSTKVPTTTTVNGHGLSGNVSVTASDVGLGAVTNDVQTKAAIVPNATPSAGQILAGNAGSTAYAPVSMSQDCTMASTGAITCTKSNNVAFGAGAFSAASTTVNGQTCALGSTCTVADSTKVPTTTTVNGHALSGNVSVTASDVGLGSVTNDAQTKAAIVPNTAPSAGQILAGNAGGTAYAPVSISGSCSMTSTGVMTCAGGGGTLNDFVTTKTSGTVVSVAGGSFRFGTNFVHIAGPITFTLQTVAISSVAPVGSTLTYIHTATPMTNLVDGQAINIQLTGTGPGCATGTGVFVASRETSTSFWVNADTSGGCALSSGTVGAQTGGQVIIFGNSAGQIEMSHSAAMGALVSVSGANGVVSQTSTGTFPNGSVPIAYVTVAAGAFDTVTDYRAALSGMQVQSGPGIDVTMVGGQAQVGVASNVPLVDQPSNWVNSVVMKNATKTLPWRTGTGSPNARDNCIDKGEAYFQTDTPTLWTCATTGTPGTWTQVQSSGVVTAANGGTGQTSYTTGDLLYASGSIALSKLAGVATGNALISGGVGAAPSWGKVGLTTHVNGILPAANGGTGVANTATLTLGTSPINFGTLGTGIVKNTTTTGALSVAGASDVVGAFTGTPDGTKFLRDDGTLAVPSLGTITRTCEVTIWGSGTAGALQTTDSSVAQCYNGGATTQTVTGVKCYADNSSTTTTVTPIIHGGGPTSLLTGALTCGNGTFAAGTLNGTPTLTSGSTVDMNISAVGTATGVRIIVTLTL